MKTCTRRLIAGAAATLVALTSGLATTLPASAAPPTTGLHSAKPIKDFQWLTEDGTEIASMKVQLVCPAGLTDVAVTVTLAGMQNYGPREDFGNVWITCTGRPQVVDVRVVEPYWAQNGPCPLPPAKYTAQVDLLQVGAFDPDLWEYPTTLISSSTAKVDVKKQSHYDDCSDWEG